ncbi:MAG TPA: hypothetical protein VGQ36_18660 [Thermoanaerobaculia bacterium]|jgi:hypothetical protein|nr:hypothetical protein [Thermoanaerobaculia bacterium]
MSQEEEFERRQKEWMSRLETVNDEQSFLRFLRALRDDCERSERECRPPHQDCMLQGHWESHSTKDFLRSAEDWGTRGDFGDGRHYGDPILRRVATMLFVGRYRIRETHPDDDGRD